MAVNRALSRIFAGSSIAGRQRGRLVAPGISIACAFGRSGIARRKREGDGATPAGALRMIALFYRADRVRRPATLLPVTAIERDNGWCDDPGDRRYNKPVRLPYPGSHERLWRDDGLYDFVVVLDYNLARPRRGAGSAIFLHIADPAHAPTAGCIAISEADMRRLLRRSRVGTRLMVR
jgi:L,D-peptidoglycan transpeptidase YkuD (ErfK/YbiS/YcfS/YnhG family)